MSRRLAKILKVKHNAGSIDLHGNGPSCGRVVIGSNQDSIDGKQWQHLTCSASDHEGHTC